MKKIDRRNKISTHLLKSELKAALNKQINNLFMDGNTATKEDIQKAYIAGAKMSLNELVQVSYQLEEDQAVKVLELFKEILDEYK